MVWCVVGYGVACTLCGVFGIVALRRAREMRQRDNTKRLEISYAADELARMAR